MADTIDPQAVLENYRSLDEKEAVNQGQEMPPEKQTLNTRFVTDFLKDKGITPDNFKDKFTLTTAIDLTSQKHSKGETEMNRLLNWTKTYLDQPGGLGGDLIESMNEAAVKSNINSRFEKRNDQDNKARLLSGYDTYRSVKMYCDRIFKVQETVGANLEKEKIQVGKGIKEDFAGAFNTVKEHWGALDGKEKLMLVAGGLIGAAMFLGSDNPRVDDIKEKLFTCCKIAGFGWLGNTAFKLVTGKTALDTIGDWTESNVANENFWTKTFKTNAEQAEILRKSTVFLGDRDFVELAEKYQLARDRGTKSIDLATMDSRDLDPKQIYTALDVFFKKDKNYGVEKLLKKYSNWNTPERPTWREVVGTELINDRSIQMDDSLARQSVDFVHTYYTKGMNLGRSALDSVKSGDAVKNAAKAGGEGGRIAGNVAGGAGAFTLGAGGAVIGGTAAGLWEGGKAAVKGTAEGLTEIDEVKNARTAALEWSKTLYRQYHDVKDVSDEEATKWWNETMSGWAGSSAAPLEKALHEKTADQDMAQGFIDACKGQPKLFNGVKVRAVVKNGAVFVAADTSVEPVLDNRKELLESPKKAYDGAKAYLLEKYPVDNIDSILDMPYLKVHIADQNVERLFIRMPLPGTEEYTRALTKTKLQGFKKGLTLHDKGEIVSTHP